MTMKKRIMFIIVSIIVLILLYYFCFMLPEIFRTTKILRLYEQTKAMAWPFQYLCTEDPEYPLSEDILSSSGEPLLSWRVSFLLNNEELFKDIDDNGFNWNASCSVDKTKPWNDESNESALNSRPFFYFYPYYLESKCGNKTCILRVKEIHEKIKFGTLREDEEKKAYLVLVDPKYAVPWTKPQDVSWKDLANGKVQLFTYPMELGKGKARVFTFPGGGSIRYYDTHGLGRYRDKAPETLEEWREFCGVDD